MEKGSFPGRLPAGTPTDAASGLVETLVSEGVRHLFINPGTDTAPVQEAMAAARARNTPHPSTVLCTHEFVALSAAMGHHFVSGAPQAVMVHVDAGTLNLGGAIHNAQRNRVPAVVFAGRSPYATSADIPGHRDAAIHWQQEQPDQQAMLRAYGKWTMEVPRGRELRGLVQRAYQVAQSDPKGLAYVMLPRESLMETAAAEPPGRLRPPRPAAPDPQALADMADSLADAVRPVVVTGRTGADQAAVAPLVRLAELFGCPVLDQRDRLNFPPRHPLYAGDTNELLREADVLLLDVEVPWVPTNVSPTPDATVLQIDVDCVKTTMPSWSFPIDLAITANTAVALPLLETELRRRATSTRTARWQARKEQVSERLHDVREEWASAARSERPAAMPEAMMTSLNNAQPPEAVVLEEAVTNRAAVSRHIVREPGRYYGTGSPAPGWAAPAAFGAKLAEPESPLIAICGDGAFNFSVPSATLWAAQRAQAPFMTIILNNRAYRASKLPVQRLYPGGAAETTHSFPETDLCPTPDYVLLARAYGGDGEVVRHPTELAGAVERCLEANHDNKCTVIDVQLPEP